MAIPKLQGYEIPATRDALPANKVKWEINPKRAALLIHDMQDYFLNFWGLDSEFVVSLVAQVKRLRAACKAAGIPVYYTAQPVNQSPEDRALLNDMWGPGIDKSPELKNVHSELAPEADDTELVKWRYSAFKRSSFKEMLSNQGRDQLIICGVYAHIGCLATGNDAFMEDIQPFLAADAVGDFTQKEHVLALEMFARNTGSVQLTGEIINSLVKSDVQKVVTELLEDEGDDEFPEEDENLIDYGLDSVKIMAFANRWKRVFPKIDFVALSQNPTISSWSNLLKA